MTFVRDYDDIDYGDEVRGEALQTVALPHDEANDGVAIGKTVEMVDGVIKAASAGNEVGVLYTYQFSGDSRPPAVRQDRKATVAVGGKVKAEVAGTVEAGDQLEADGSGVLAATGANTHGPYVALSDARQQDNDNPNGGSGEHYAEVLLR
jgi:hypothetical protein